jgi:phage tail sheath protein FI
MVTLNNNRNNTAYIIGDTPLRLPDQATDLINWATNQAGAISTGEDGLVTRNEYMGLFYPSGITTDLTGAAVVVPASHMMLRTFLRNDTIAYPWLAPAGTRRGTIDNATNIGYLDAATGEFVVIKNRMAIRDVLYTNQINPLAYFTGIGLLNYGNKNVKDTQSALDRINVARLVAYIRYQLQILARPFVFEPNDALTRSQIQGVVQSLFIDLVAKRGLYDYLVVCDDSNNTPARIDRNELWIDVAIEPVKAAEFIYIPVRVLNTGEIASLK